MAISKVGGSQANEDFESVSRAELAKAAAARAQQAAAAAQQAALSKAGVTDTSGFQKSAAAPTPSADTPKATAPAGTGTVRAADLATGGSKALDKALPTAQKAFDVNEPSVNPKNVPSQPFPEGTAAAGAKKFELGSDRTSLASVMAAKGGQPALSREAVVGTVLSAIPAGQREAAKALIAAGVTDDSLAKAFAQVVDARGTPGEKTLSLGLVALESKTTTVGSGEGTYEQTAIVPASKPTTFDCKLSVSAEGKVNGAELPADLATRVAAATTLVAPSVKDATLREAGLSPEWMQAASPEQKGLALAQILEARQTPGVKTLDLGIDYSKSVGSGEDQTTVSTHAAGTLKLDVAADGKVNGKPLSIDATWAAEAKPFPDGNSADKVKTKFELPKTGTDLAALTAANGDQPALAQQAVVDTVLSAIPEAQRAGAKALIDAGVTSDSLAKAFSQVVDARGTPGEKSLSLGLVALESKTTEVGWGENRSTQTELVAASKPTVFDCKLSVSADGKVNGAELPADLATRVGTTLKPVAAEYKDATLREAGLSPEWLQNASEAQKSYALAKIVDAKATPGVKSLDLGFPYTATTSVGEETKSVNTFAAGTLKLDVAADGKVNGKALTIDAAYNATRAIEAMSTADRKKTLQALGFAAGPILNASSEQVRAVLVKAAVSTATPGEKQFEVTMGGDKYAVGMKVGENGQILASATQFIPPPPSSSIWKSIVSVVCTVVSFVNPLLAPICQGIQGAIAISNGASGLGLLGAVVGVAGGLGDLAGVAGAANLTSMAGTINTVNGAVNALQNGDVLGFLSNSLTVGAGFASGDLANTLSSAARIAGGASGLVNAARNGDVLGLIGSGISTASAVGGLAGFTISEGLKTVGDIANTGSAISNGDIAGALTGVLGLAGVGKPPKTEEPSEVDTAAATDETAAPEDDTSDAVSRRGVSGVTTADGEEGGVKTVGDLLADTQAAIDAPAEVPERKFVTVGKGDNLSKLAEKAFGDPNRWPEIYDYNRDKLGSDPNKLPLGVELELPPEDYTLSSSRKNALYTAAYIPPSVKSDQPSLTAQEQVAPQTAAIAAANQAIDAALATKDPGALASVVADLTAADPDRMSSADGVKMLGNSAGLATTWGEEALKGMVARGMTASGMVGQLEQRLEDAKAMVRTAADLAAKGVPGASAEALRLSERVKEIETVVSEVRGATTSMAVINGLKKAAPILSGFSAIVDAVDSKVVNTTTGKSALVAASMGSDLALGAAFSANPAVLMVDGALKVIDPAARMALKAMGFGDIVSPTERFALSAQLSGAINNIIGLTEAVVTGDGKGLDQLRADNQSGKNGVLIQGFSNLGELISLYTVLKYP